MPTPTYDLIASNILDSNAAVVTFSSVPQTYRDIQLVITNTITGGQGIYGLRFNNDSSGNYSFIQAIDGTASTSSTGDTYARTGYQSSGNSALNITNIMDYSATNKHKTILSRDNSVTFSVRMSAARWASNSAITSISCVMDSGNWVAGSSFYLYGIAS